MTQTPESRDPNSHKERRFARQLARLAQAMPRVGSVISTLTAPGRMLIRVPLAFLFILGGLVGFLPIVGFWMLPLGLMLLAVDLPQLRPAVSAASIRARVLIRKMRR